MKKLVLFCIFSLFVIVSCQSEKKETSLSNSIRINQLGFYPNSIKQFVVVDNTPSTFKIIDTKGKTVFSGDFKDNGVWEQSGENVFLGDFSALNTIGTYYVLVDNKLQSYPFEIKKGIYTEALNASIKSFYFQRASMPIEEQYGGVFKRKEGHADANCLFHPSSGKLSGTLSAPGGWYDAGDYGKYIVNAAFSTGQMLNLLEQFPNVIKDGDLNIPESGNGISDLWDELKYELDWVLTMQDDDGGVYHKLTGKNFSGFILPEDYDLDRYIIGKGTAATLNFAAVLAQASRLYKNIDKVWSSNALNAAEKAWDWAVLNDNVPFANPEDVKTGEYGDNDFSDDFYWAATELFLATNKEPYLAHLMGNNQAYIHQLTNSWKFFVRNMGFHSLLVNKDLLSEDFATALTQNHIKLADAILEKLNKNPYRIALDLFEWGSNSDILNQAIILCYAHSLTKEEKYLNGAEQITDYIFGKNATGYSFLTGFGSKKVMFPHHRPSGADDIENPVPGFIVGGPNKDKQDSFNVTYTSKLPAKSFMDVQKSFASNEVCLNWNSPVVFVLGYLEQVRK
ncbi:endoglucanase [Lutibacter oceani]|uniref:Endoglucanase n=1 Tax=Lutibacter oceani TaxID=1853311 RepID=A0A3D9S1Z8_9FLAO|nr:glycoside hydrolase family 9 protein [Lutibacter oceani]REE82885.1 endoglucanase [Lutibacter oceani]